MRAHLFLEGGGMVTGTHDVAAARRLIVATYMDEHPEVDDDRQELAYVSRKFRASEARQEVGRIVPESPVAREYSGYAWWWRSGYTLGKRGVTRAVVWDG